MSQYVAVAAQVRIAPNFSCFSGESFRDFTPHSCSWAFLFRNGAGNAPRGTKANGMGVGQGARARSDHGVSDRASRARSVRNESELCSSSLFCRDFLRPTGADLAPNAPGLHRGFAPPIPGLQALIPLLLPPLAIGALAAQAHWLAGLAWLGLAVVNALAERRGQAAWQANAFGLVVPVCGLAAFGPLAFVLILALWRMGADTRGLHRFLARLGPASGAFSGWALWPMLVLGISLLVLGGRASLFGTALGTPVIAAVFAWIGLAIGLACAGIWLSGKIACWRMHEALSLRDAHFALLGLALPIILAAPPDLAISLCLLAGLRLSANLARPTRVLARTKWVAVMPQKTQPAAKMAARL